MGKKYTSVSLITVNQYKRSETIKILASHIIKQTYKNILQWVIVEGSPNIEDAILNEACIKLLQETFESESSIKINYIKATCNNTNVNHKLGELRNIGNRACIGDITVCMDDDDYYFPTRVEHAVERLSNSKYLIAGCSAKYMYDFELRKFYKFKSFGPNHSTNDCMAWKKAYLDTHSHDPNASNAEESSFTKNFTEPMIQLDPNECIISCSHSMNTFNKKELCVFGAIGMCRNIDVLDDHIDDTKYMGVDIYNRYVNIYIQDREHTSPYDIVYFTGGTSIDWKPSDTSLGGSEQAVVHLASEFAKLGKRVGVYGRVPTCIHNGVEYFDWKLFDYNAKYKIIIMWRLSGIHTLLPFDVKTDKLYLDLHDNKYQFRIDYTKYAHKIDKIFFKSAYHLEIYNKTHNVCLPKEKYAVIPNGIRISDFSKNIENVTRNPYRFCYCSCYTRGLAEILQYIWPIIYKYEPRAELHVYYGMFGIQDNNYKMQMSSLLSQPGVMDHSRMPMHMIIREKWMSTYQLYITDTDAEIDCISIRESICSGCIPLLSKFGVFKEREGIHFDLDRLNPESYTKITKGILKILKTTEFAELCRIKMSTSETLIDWSTVANKWINVMD